MNELCYTEKEIFLCHCQIMRIKKKKRVLIIDVIYVKRHNCSTFALVKDKEQRIEGDAD